MKSHQATTVVALLIAAFPSCDQVWSRIDIDRSIHFGANENVILAFQVLLPFDNMLGLFYSQFRIPM
jgi:hypothetical protein